MKANCSICSDLFDGVNTIIATPCGHVFHEICCYQWLEHSKTCPACRRKMTMKCIVKLYFTLGSEDSNESEGCDNKLKNELESAKAELKLKDMEKHKLLLDMDDLRKAVISAENEADVNHQKFLGCQEQTTATRLQLKQVLKEMSTLQNVSDENKRLLSQLTHLKNVQSIISDCQGEVNQTLSSWGSGSSVNSKETATYIVMLKRELQSSRESRTKLAKEVHTLKYELGLKSSQAKELKEKLQESENELDFLRDALDAVETPNNDQKRTPSNSKRKSMLLNKSSAENIPTPFKRPKVDRVSSVVSMVHQKPAAPILQAQNIIRVPQESQFRPQDTSSDDISVISEGYNGFGGHTKFVSRSAPLKMKFTSVHKKPTKKASNPTLDKYIEL